MTDKKVVTISNLQQVVGEIPWGQNLVILYNKLPTQKDIKKVLKE